MKNIDSALDTLSKLPPTYRDEIKSNFHYLELVENSSRWRKTFVSISQSLDHKRKRGSYKQVEDHIFELKVMSFLISSIPQIKLCYEPLGLDRDAKRVDLSIQKENKTYLIELKAFHPIWKSTEIPQKYITENNEVCMDGNTYHGFQAVREHLMDMAFGVEDKIMNYPSNSITVMGVSLDFHLDIEDFRDFVAHYKLKRHRFDDPLGKMAEHKLCSLNRQYRYTIDSFWGFPFEQTSFYFRNDEDAVCVASYVEDDVPIKL